MVGLENPLHIAIVLLVVLLVFGAKRLPEMGSSLGHGIRGFKQALTGEQPSAELGSEQPTDGPSTG
jgi:sec-independent protein translocase protein TatA